MRLSPFHITHSAFRNLGVCATTEMRLHIKWYELSTYAWPLVIS